MTEGLLKACKKKMVLYEKFIKHRTSENEDNYKKYKNKLTTAIRIRKKQYYDEILDKNRNDTRRTWKILNNIIQKRMTTLEWPNYFLNSSNHKVNDLINIVEEFNKFFVSVGPSLANEIAVPPDADTFNNLINSNINSMFLHEISETDVVNTVRKFKNKKSTDINEIDMGIIKEVIFSIVRPLTYIYNLSLQKGHFPKTMKITKVIPTFKTGNKHSMENYRPIAIIPQFSKILEKLFVNQLDVYITKNKLLSDSQYGFRKNRTTTYAIMQMVEEIAQASESEELSISIFVDLKKAFDTIDHRRLLKKMENYGLRGIAKSWIESYLKDRQQYVKIKDIKSGFREISCGVPQGSVIGPILFTLYINDICNVADFFKFIMFADDTNLVCSGKDIKELLKKAEKELNILKSWFDVNKLSLNIKKTKFMIFGNKKVKNGDFKLTISDTEIERVSEIKFLGVVIDSNLSWKHHLNYIKGKIAKSLGLLYKLKDILNHKALRLIYCSLIQPYMAYCIEIWGSTFKTYIHEIKTIQKKSIRVMNKSNYYAHTDPLFLKSQIMKLEDLYYYKIMQFMFRVKLTALPKNILMFFVKRESKYDLRGVCMFVLQKAKKGMKRRCISVMGVKFWNEAKIELKLATSLSVLKKLISKNIFEEY
uniref:Reverse transcriptase domain-containing protein n=1 Tax=Nothobranchius furzeri TaxID=105023 RepID=A0A8C6NYB4_NOTFU